MTFWNTTLHAPLLQSLRGYLQSILRLKSIVANSLLKNWNLQKSVNFRYRKFCREPPQNLRQLQRWRSHENPS